MKKYFFHNIKKENIDAAKELLSEKGDCMKSRFCKDCPFNSTFAAHGFKKEHLNYCTQLSNVKTYLAEFVHLFDPVIEIELLIPDAVPARTTKFDSGMDLKAMGYREVKNGELGPIVRLLPNEKFIITSGETALILSGIKIGIPEPIEEDKYYRTIEAQVRSRSGMALKHNIFVLNSPGTVDNEFRGEIGVILHNASHSNYKISYGDKVAQLVFTEVLIPKEIRIVEAVSQTTSRSENGFGSSGKA